MAQIRWMGAIWRARRARFSVAVVLAAALGLGSLVSLSGPDSTLAAGGAPAPATWTSESAAASGPLASASLTGAADALEYAFGLEYAGDTTGHGVAISGSGRPNGVVEILQGDTLTGSAAAWSATAATAGPSATPQASPDGTPAEGQAPGVQVAGSGAASADLGGQLTVTPSSSSTAGVSQVRWQIANADAAKVNPGQQDPATLTALPGPHDGSASEPSDSSASVRVFVANPRLTTEVEVCTTGTDCDPAAAVGEAGWSAKAVLPAGVTKTLARLTASNTGNVAMTAVKVATAEADTADVSAGVGKSIGDLAVGQTAVATIPLAVTSAAHLTASVSGEFTGAGPDGKALANRFTDAAGAVGRVPSVQASAHVSQEQGPPATPAPTPSATPAATPVPAGPLALSGPSGSGSASGGSGLAGGAVPIAPTADALNSLGITAVLNSAASQPSGYGWQYLISLSCSASVAEGCTSPQITIPPPPTAAAQTGVAGAWAVWTLPSVTGDPTLLGGAASKAFSNSGGNWVLALSRALSSGESVVLTMTLSVANFTTPNGFTWALTPSVSGTNAPTATAATTATATATAAATCNSRTGGGTISGPMGSTQVMNNNAYFGSATASSTSGQLAPAPGTTVTESVTYPAALTYVSDGSLSRTPGTLGAVVSTPDPATRTLTYSLPVTPAVNTAVGLTINANFNLTGPVGSYTIAFSGSFVPLGSTEPMACTSGLANASVLANTITGTIWGKSVTGVSPFSAGTSVTGSTSATPSTTNYVTASREDMSLTLSYWSLTVNRNNGTLEDIHIFDGMPCLTSGSGTTTATPYQSLAEADAPCTAPAFHVQVLRSAGALDGQQVTVEYSDGTSTVVSPTTSGTAPNGNLTLNCTATSPCFFPDPLKTVASVILNGSYSVNDASASKSLQIYGAPLSTFSTDRAWYLRNSATGSGSQFATSTYSVGMVTPQDSVRLAANKNLASYTYTPTWSGNLTNYPCTAGPGANCVMAYTSDPALASQRRTAVVIPDGSGMNVTQVRPYFSGAIVNTPVPAVSGDYDGLGAASNLYVIDASQLANGTVVPDTAGVGVNVAYGGMEPGVYVYYVYTGLTHTNPTDGGASCTTNGGTLVTDTTGIIGEPGVPRQLCRAADTITVTSSSAGVNVSKTVQDVTTGSGWVAAPNAVVASPGDTVQFRIRVSNTGPAALTNVALYDILPYAGDTGISSAMLGQPRGSTGTVPLASLPDTPSGWTLAYSTSTNPCRPEVGVPVGTAACADSWNSAATVADVRALRLTIGALPVATAATPYHDLILTYTVPSVDKWAPTDVEWNSVAAGGTYGALTLSPAEPAKVGFAGQLTFLYKVGRASGGAAVGQAGSAWQVLSDDHGSAGAPVSSAAVTPVPGQTGLFTITGLGEGTWWLRETQAPEGFELLATPMRFTIDVLGRVAVGNDVAAGYAAGTVSVGTGVAGVDDTTGRWVMTITDVRHQVLPATGSTAARVSQVVGGVLLGLAAVASLILGIRSRRSRSSRSA